jgi:membrane protease YdiL (CAAX protease family)
VAVLEDPDDSRDVNGGQAAPAASRRRALLEALGASAAVTIGVTLASMLLPDRAIATAVGFLFLGATWLLVWRKDDAYVTRCGLDFGGLVIPGRLEVRRIAVSALRASAWALAFAAVAFVPFYFGWRAWWHVYGTFALSLRPADVANEVFGQLVIIALPEEAFYRGYLQTRLDEVWAPRLAIGGARVGLGLVVASVIFALGHLATIHVPARLAVFFPALLFGWLRARTGGVGAGLVFHALCNVFSEALGRGFGVY